MATQEPLTGGELNAAVTSALVGIQSRYLGRGPRSASTFYHDNVLVTLMYGVLTVAEQALSRSDHADSVTNTRHLYQTTMEGDFREAVERLSGRKVVAFVSGNHIDPDIAVETFILDAPL
ncbi:MAG TPA: Na-translocating system protein MpsC family protein [Solirubrobacteraceae bacterium]|nr:Na-translocating system protein MpsC family protein [Solirubrobacteraceae bacterium]